MIGAPSPRPRSGFPTPFLVGAVVGLALAGLAAAACAFLLAPRPDASTYQAVFLTNGQAYFGKLRGASSRTPVLDDVYYLQTPVQGQASGTPQFSLAKLGQGEVHGPQDRMFINRDQLLFWEDLRQDSQVLKTIGESKSRKQ